MADQVSEIKSISVPHVFLEGEDPVIVKELLDEFHEKIEEFIDSYNSVTEDIEKVVAKMRKIEIGSEIARRDFLNLVDVVREHSEARDIPGLNFIPEPGPPPLILIVGVFEHMNRMAAQYAILTQRLNKLNSIQEMMTREIDLDGIDYFSFY